ncbi:cytochrome o ubiquinol oxidase subunit III [Parvibaculum sp.]|uniref:cytochrome o ubiquinol oxidase subunit III n=1 Tax=Parvibaculum sp. TaxID=2024848 RepID=UPI000C8E5C84|nr:cytochrome o ubiquinol oxidase subunit III [Parvibaculum sp.]MAB12841.1 cytochrome o ubiquinol oxidase subunit III [Parvibaculum sp.]
MHTETAHSHEAMLFEEREFGFWIYLMSDAIIFSLLFATYAVMRHATAGGPGAADIMELPTAAIETALLLLASVTFGMAAVALEDKRRNAILVWLGISFLLGAGFLGMEIHEFIGLIAEGASPQRSGYLSSFFVLVGTHGAHVTAGLVWIATAVAQLMRTGPTEAFAARFKRLGLFWHFLDIVWIGIFSIVYLPGVLQ